MKASLFAAALFSGVLLAAPVGAAPAGMAKDVGAAAPTAEIELVHGNHRSCERGPAGWHYHNRFGDRIACVPRPRGLFFTWRCEGERCGWWHRTYRRWH